MGPHSQRSLLTVNPDIMGIYDYVHVDNILKYTLLPSNVSKILVLMFLTLELCTATQCWK